MIFDVLKVIPLRVELCDNRYDFIKRINQRSSSPHDSREKKNTRITSLRYQTYKALTSADT